MKVKRQITLKDLKEKQACSFGRDFFKKTFGNGGTVTLARLQKAERLAPTRNYLSWFFANFIAKDNFDTLEGRGDKAFVHARERYFAAPGGSQREAHWLEKMSEARIATVWRLWNEAQ